MSASRFEVFNVETGEIRFILEIPLHSPAGRRKQALARAKAYIQLMGMGQSYAVRLWEKGSPIPTIVYSPA